MFCLFCPTHSSLSHTHIRGAGGNVTLKSVAGFLRDVASEAVAAAFALIKSLPKVLLHLVIGQETRVFCVETVRATWLLQQIFYTSLQALVAAHLSDLSYYDPDGVQTESSFGALKDRAVLGSEQHVVGFFSCAQTDSHCLLL